MMKPIQKAITQRLSISLNDSYALKSNIVGSDNKLMEGYEKNTEFFQVKRALQFRLSMRIAISLRDVLRNNLNQTI